MNINLEGKVVLVTGASRGIGASIASLLGASGATVAAHANSNIENAQKIASTISNNSKAFQADLSDPEEVLRLYSEVMSAYGRIDVLINNAGIAISSPLESDNHLWVDEWRKTLDVNLLATGLLCKQVLTHWDSGGIIINISSRAAHRGDTEDYLAYGASKGGMEAITKSIARAYGKNGVTAFGVAPGFTRTDMAQDFIDAYGEDYATSDLALDELTEPKDIAQTVVFLASGLAKHATGSTIDINAGSYVR